MTKRISERDLTAAVDRINRLTKSPLTSYTVDKKGKYTANIGNYHLDWAYGGVTLHRMHSSGGGVEDVLHCGYVSKPTLYKLLHAFINGLEALK